MIYKAALIGIGFLMSVNAWAQPDNFKYGMGIPEGPDEEYDKLPIKAKLTRENYRSVDTKASLEKYAPTPKSQGQYGTCTAWAAGYCGRTILEAGLLAGCRGRMGPTDRGIQWITVTLTTHAKLRRS